MEHIVKRTETICSSPDIYNRLNEVINHPRASLKDIARIINTDQGLTVRLLKLANSPLFGYFSKIDSINRAVTVVGTQQLRDLALAVSVMGAFKGVPENLMSMSLFWRHSVACGVFSRNLGVYLREPNVERLFVVGILHDLGQLVLCSAIPETVAKLLKQSLSNQQLHHLTERQELDFDHADLGGALMEAWQLPENIVEPVVCHHHPNRASKYPLEAAIVHLADIFCQAMEFGCSGERYVSPLQPNAWERIGIPVNMMATIIRQSEAQIDETFAILSEPL